MLIADHRSFYLFNQRAAVLSLSHTLLMYYDHNRCNKQNNGTSKSLVRRPIDILHLCSSNAVQYLRQTELFYSIWAHSFIAIGCRCAVVDRFCDFIAHTMLACTLAWSLCLLLDRSLSLSPDEYYKHLFYHFDFYAFWIDWKAVQIVGNLFVLMR